MPNTKSQNQKRWKAKFKAERPEEYRAWKRRQNQRAAERQKAKRAARRAAQQQTPAPPQPLPLPAPPAPGPSLQAAPGPLTKGKPKGKAAGRYATDEPYRFLVPLNEPLLKSPHWLIDTEQLPPNYRDYFATSGDALWKVQRWLDDLAGLPEDPRLEPEVLTVSQFRRELERCRGDAVFAEVTWESFGLVVAAKNPRNGLVGSEP